jgi:hypothetical protein
MLDYDGKELGYKRSLGRVKRVFEVDSFLKIKTVRIHQTKNGFHTRIIVGSEVKLSDSDIITIQVLLKSDYMREVFNFLRIKSGVITHWNILFKSKWKLDKNGNKVILSQEKPRQDLEEYFKKKVMEVKRK